MSMHQFIRDWLADPLALLAIFTALFLVLPALFRRFSVRTLLVCLLWFALVAIASSPRAVNPLVSRIETRFEAEPPCLADKPIVVLGGGLDSGTKSADQFELLSQATIARTAAALRLAGRFPDAPLLLSGGALREVSEAEVMAALMVRSGIDPERLLQESTSASTFENAQNVARQLEHKDLQADIILVTSALHLPRATAVFQKAGMEVCPLGHVGRIGLDKLPRFAWMPQTTALVKFDSLLHEWLATAVYWLNGRL